MNRRKVLVVDDDVFIAEQLNAILSDLGYTVVGMAMNKEMAYAFMDQDRPDMVLLDINMHGVNQGFGIAHYLNQASKIPFIFVTSFSDNATVAEASLLRPMAYIVKPFNERDIYTTLEIAFSNINKQQQFLTLNSEDGKFNIPLADILWIKADDKYLEIQTVVKKHLYRSTLNDVQGLLNPSFCRVHRSYIINLNHVSSFKGNLLKINQVEIPISRSFLTEFKTKFEQQ